MHHDSTSSATADTPYRSRVGASIAIAPPAQYFDQVHESRVIGVFAMPLAIRPAIASDLDAVQRLVMDSFEPITWQKKLDVQFGPLNGRDWRARWRSRLEKIFQTQIVLLGESDGLLAAMASGLVDRDSALGFIDVLA